MPANESFHLQRLWGLIREQEFYICHSPAFSGITQSFCCVSKRRSICGIPVFGNKIDLYQFLYRLLGQGSNFNYTDMYRKQCPSLVLRDAPVTNGNILPYSSLRNLSPACGQRQSFGQVSKKDIWRIGSHCVQRHLHIALGESGSWAGFEHWEGNNPLHKENFHWRASKIVKQTNIWCFPKSGTATPPLRDVLLWSNRPKSPGDQSYQAWASLHWQMAARRISRTRRRSNQLCGNLSHTFPL